MSDLEKKKSFIYLANFYFINLVYLILYKENYEPLRYYHQQAQPKPKINELEETPQKYAGTERIKHLFHSIS